jgi:hypothetical protein
MPAKYDKAFSRLRPYLGKAAFVHIGDGVTGLSKGLHPITVFDWTELDDDGAGMLVESHLFELATEAGEGWSKKRAPFAVIGGETHPVPLDELDQQCDGVLLFDLENGKGGDCPVLLCDDPSNAEPITLAASFADLKISGKS